VTNGSIDLTSATFDSSQIGVIALGQLPQSLSTMNFEFDITINIPLLGPSISLLGVEDEIIFYKEVKDPDGNVLSRDPINPQPENMLSGGVEVIGPIRFLTPRAFPFTDPFTREPANPLFSTMLQVNVFEENVLTPGSYQGDIWITSGVTRIGKMIINLQIIEVVFNVDPNVSFYHNV
jgi:hypothetical protein